MSDLKVLTFIFHPSTYKPPFYEILFTISAPLVLIKKTIKDVKKEISDMDISISVAEHSIVEAKLREKSLESHLIRTTGI